VRLTLVTETFPPEINGVALTNYRLARALGRNGHDIELVRPLSNRGDLQPEPVGDSFYVRGWPVPFYRGVLLGQFCPQRLLRRWQDHRPEVVHIATEGPLGLAALIAASRLGIPVTSTFHTSFHIYCRHYGVPFLTSYALRYLRWFHNRCVLTFVPTADLLMQLGRTGFKRLELLGRGVDRDLFHPNRRSAQLRKTWGAADHTPVILSVGRLAREKNLPLILEAFTEIQRIRPEARMVVVGDGPMSTHLRCRFPHACYPGLRLDEDLATHYASADLFFFSSTTETFGNVVLEAMASGLAVLSYDYAAAAQHIQHGRSGILVPFNRPQLFRDAATRLVGQVPLWSALGRAARAATERVPWDFVTERFERALCLHARLVA
jgi:glycosyltransferase involved in cell wall biosynthesis